MENDIDLQETVLKPSQTMVFFFEDYMTEEDFKFRLTDLVVTPYEFDYIDSTELRFLTCAYMIRSGIGFMDNTSVQFQPLQHFGLQDPIFVRFSRGNS